MHHPTLARTLPAALLLAVTLSSCGDRATDPRPTDDSLPAILRRQMDAHGLPAMAAAVVRGDSVAEIACLGVRRLGAPDTVTLTDHYHVGSNVKAMTADLVAMEVEAGHLAWDRTLAEIFPEFADSMQPQYRTVTLEALLQHRSGLPPFTTVGELVTVPAFTGTLTERRAALARWLLGRPPAATPGQYLYSNGGYALAGSILERSAGGAWEIQMESRLWSPLGIAGGFGWPAAGGAPQPWGHLDAGGGTLVPHDPDAPGEEFPDLLRPAGDAHMSIGDYARFARLHLRALRGHPELLSGPTFATLHAPNGSYAMGWGVQPVAGATTSFHVGSAGTFAVCVMLQADRDVAVVVASNAGSDGAITAVQAAAIQVLTR